MTSPLLDEGIMLAALENVATKDELKDNRQRLAAGATMLLVDAYDRKVTRDMFLVCVSAAMGLIDVLGHYDMMGAVEGFLEDVGGVTHADVAITLQNLLDATRKKTERCTELATALTKCPLDEDTLQ